MKRVMIRMCNWTRIGIIYGNYATECMILQDRQVGGPGNNLLDYQYSAPHVKPRLK